MKYASGESPQAGDVVRDKNGIWFDQGRELIVSHIWNQWIVFEGRSKRYIALAFVLIRRG
jgi:hypothetical protein